MREPAGDGDLELIAKFEDEVKHEENSGLEGLDGSLENFKFLLENSPWEVKDVSGEEKVALTKKFGNETIRVTFSIADLQSLAESRDYDDALTDEDYTAGEHATGQSQATAGKTGAPSQNRAAETDRELEDDSDEPGFPARVHIAIEKPGSGSLLVQTVAQDGVFEIEDISFFDKPELTNAETAENDWIKQGLYVGPPFENLDEDLQAYFERYLEERGIDTELANAIPDYIQVKEQKEYVRWLKNVKDFVAA